MLSFWFGWLTWAAIGTVVGLFLGLTGAGGAMIGVPLLVHIAGLSIKAATGVSLIAVVAGALLNWILQRHYTDYRLAMILFSTSMIGGLVGRPIKTHLHENAITALFIAVGLISIWSIWKKKKSPRASTDGHPPAGVSYYFALAVAGIILGLLTTLTGLGGGILLVPFLVSYRGLSITHATATSLLTVSASSSFVMILQFQNIMTYAEWPTLVSLCIGILIAAQLTKILIQKIPTQRLDPIRKILITLIVLISAIGLLV